ncbi:MAG TPA: nucleotidyltransferase family protein [Spirochaetia bacterium]|nr:nucleotidyltransferase family protein [Spirochaetia bacterium]
MDVDHTIIILCGGLATRLRPITEKIPKSIVDVDGRPFLEYQLERLAERGLHNVVLSIGYLGEMVEEVIGDGGRFGLSVRYAYDGPKLLGTAGAIRKAREMLSSPFFIQYGDSFLDVDYSEVARAYADSRKKALMTVFRNEGQWDRSNVLYRDNTLVAYRKRQPTADMNYIDYGLSMVDGSVFDRLPANEFSDLSDLFEQLSIDGQLAGLEVFNRFYEIGTVDGLNETSEYLKTRRRN